MLFVFWFFSAVAAAVDFVWGDFSLFRLLALGCLAQLPAVFLTFYGKLRASVFWMTGLYALLVTALATTGQGIHDYAVMAYPAVILFSGVALGKRGLVMSVAISAAAVFWLVAGEINGWYVPRGGFSPNWLDVVFAEMLLTLAAAAAFFLISILEASVSEARREMNGRRLAEDTLRQRELHVRSLFENAVVGIYRTAPDGAILFANPAAVRALGYDSFNELARLNLERDELVSQPSRAQFVERMRRDGSVSGLQSVWRRKDGSAMFVRESATAVKDKNGRIVYYDGIFEDVTEYQRAEKSLREAQAQLDLFFSVSLDLLCIADTDGHFRRLNPQWQETLGYPLGQMEGKKFLDFVHPEDLPATREALALLAAGADVISFENRYRRQDGSYRWLEWRSTPVGKLIYAAARDVTERKQIHEQLRLRVAEVEALQAELREQALRDPLTGLYNRRYMQDALQREFARASRERHSFSVLMLDMDDLKVLNDNYGHAAGDEALRAFAACLKDMTRAEDIVCRYGGDEFIIAISGAAAEDAFRRTEEWRAFLANRPLKINEQEATIRFTAGIASFPAQALSLDELVHYADAALYRAKARGRNCSQIFS